MGIVRVAVGNVFILSGKYMKSACANSENLTLVDFLKSDDPDLFAKAEGFTAFLDDWKGHGSYSQSYHRILSSPCSGASMLVEPGKAQRKMIMLSSNNYLGLNTRPEVIEAAVNALRKYGSGMGGSRLLCGTYELVVELERELADFEGCEEAVVFTTGYQANLGTISAIMRKGDLALIDRLSHASIVDGCRLAGCALHTFRHNDMNHLRALLEQHASKSRGILIAVDGVFSMDGDLAPLPDIVETASQFGARVMVDEAHATGVLGRTGRGTVEHFGLEGKVDIILGTFSKTLCATGGYIATSREVATYVRHYGRSYMFSASPTPAVIGSVLAALRIVKTEPDLRKKLWSNVRYMHTRLRTMGFDVFPAPPESAVITVRIGPDETVRAMSIDLHNAGLFASSVVYPAVALNQGRLRISLSASHEQHHLDLALAILEEVGLAHGILGSPVHEDSPYSTCSL